MEEVEQSMRIEREILIEAPVEVVWSVVTEPDQMSQWFAEEVHLTAEPGAEGVFVYRDKSSGTTSTVRLRVEQVRRPELFAFRWVYPDGAEPQPGNSVLVEFTLHPEGDKTRLRVVESGFDELDWSDQAKADYIQDHTSGWRRLFDKLQDHIAKHQSVRS
ncbi:MAG TPA: SRPBCC domain-containing protein [Candidatus Dormibacteraeota bacterium]|nr:SRPBCC domain-containing protein [Candidatus Dormibacteraeota bacterium]